MAALQYLKPKVTPCSLVWEIWGHQVAGGAGEGPCVGAVTRPGDDGSLAHQGPWGGGRWKGSRLPGASRVSSGVVAAICSGP